MIGQVAPLALTMVQAVIGGAALFVLSLTLEPINATTMQALATPVVLGSILFLSVFGTIVAYTLYLVLLRDWGSVRAGLYAFVSPIVALAVGAWLFGETVGTPEVIGAILLLTAAAWRCCELASRMRDKPRAKRRAGRGHDDGNAQPAARPDRRQPRAGSR